MIARTDFGVAKSNKNITFYGGLKVSLKKKTFQALVSRQIPWFPAPLALLVSNPSAIENVSCFPRYVDQKPFYSRTFIEREIKGSKVRSRNKKITKWTEKKIFCGTCSFDNQCFTAFFPSQPSTTILTTGPARPSSTGEEGRLGSTLTKPSYQPTGTRHFLRFVWA